jgi:nicotinic acid mononucleotide adenylyltransferase
VNQDQKTRIGGLIFIIGGAVLAYLSIWTPYREALSGAQTVALNRTGIALSILFPLMGAVLVAGGEAVNTHLKAHATGKKTIRGWIYIAIIGAIAIGVYYAVQSKFESMGYTL